MTWENSENSNDMDIWSETVLLRHIFEEGYNFQVDSYKIPFKDPIRKVQERLNQYERQFSSPDNLLIVYYGGHGGSSQGMGLYLGPSFVETFQKLFLADMVTGKIPFQKPAASTPFSPGPSYKSN
jgi:hypothetical protein